MIMVFAPAGTPVAALEKLNTEISRIVEQSKPVRDRLMQLGLDPTTMSLKEADAFVRSEMGRWEGMICRAGLEKS